MTTYSVALTSTLHNQATQHLLCTEGQEDLCFALWYPSDGHTRQSALLSQLILPEAGERQLHGNASFLPQYFERAISAAVAANAGLAFIHSHLGPGWQGMSEDDVQAELQMAAAVKGATGLPLVGMTLGTDGAWSARFWIKTAPRIYEQQWCTHVRVAGEQLSVTYMDSLMPPPQLKEELRRTVSSWGLDTQAQLTRLRVGIVGAGSVGDMVAESLARTGIAYLTPIDYDSVEFVNLDRLIHATWEDAAEGRAKVAVLARGARKGATADGFVVDEVEYSIAEEEGYRAALDCDLLFSCVDSHWARSILNFIAYAHLIPVIDGGIRIEVNRQGKMRRADWKAHTAGHGHRCLACNGQYDPGLVAAEREGHFDDPRYIEGLPDDHSMRRNENVFAFSHSVASMQVMQLLSMIVAPMGMPNPGEQMYHFVPGIMDAPRYEECSPGCPYPEELLAKGDRTGIQVTGRHPRAEIFRADRRSREARRVAGGARGKTTGAPRQSSRVLYGRVCLSDEMELNLGANVDRSYADDSYD